MNARIRTASWIFCAIGALTLAAGPLAIAQTHPAAAPTTQAPSEKDVADAQEQLLHLLRLSPTLTAAVAADPSLLADQAYVARTNPELAQFLVNHPAVAPIIPSARPMITHFPPFMAMRPAAFLPATAPPAAIPLSLSNTSHTQTTHAQSPPHARSGTPSPPE